MTRDEEKFLSLDGLVQWTSAVITQADRLAQARISVCTPETFRLTAAALRTETDLFVAAAWKVFEFRKWVSALGLSLSVDFSEIDRFDTQDIRDLRNMREHVVDYFRGLLHWSARLLVAASTTRLLLRLRGDFCLSFSKNPTQIHGTLSRLPSRQHG
jgi:hypothetical protein